MLLHIYTHSHFHEHTPLSPTQFIKKNDDTLPLGIFYRNKEREREDNNRFPFHIDHSAMHTHSQHTITIVYIPFPIQI